MNINIKITEGCGIVVNRNELSLKEANLKDQLYGAPVQQPPERDRPSQPKPPIQPKPTATTAKKPLKKPVEEHKVSEGELRQFEREMNGNIKEFSKSKTLVDSDQASLGMLHTNNQIIRTQQQLLTEQQHAIKQLQRKKSQESEPRRPAEQREPQQVLRDMTSGLNRQLDEMRRLRDDMMRTAKEFMQSLGKVKAGEAPSALPPNLVEMNKNLKAMVQTSQQNIDLLSPEKLELLGKLQNFNLEGYTQQLNSLKSQVAMVQRESDQVEKQLKQRLAKLEKLTITPKFDEQLVQPYQQNIKKQLQTIDLQQAKRSVIDRLGGDFDYIKFDAELATVASETKQEMADFYFTLQQYRIDVPDLKLDAKQLKALDIKLPSILEEYKNAKGIVTPAPRPAPLGRTGQAPRAQLGKTGASHPRGTTGQLAQTGSARKTFQQTGDLSKGKQPRQRSIEQLVTKPKDLATNVKYKNMSEDEPFNTVLNRKTVNEALNQAEQERNEAERRTKPPPEVNPAKPQPKRKTREEEDFQKYLESRANEELEQLYKERRDKLARMKNELYEEATDEPAIQLRVDRRNRIELERPSQKKPQPPQPKKDPNFEQLGEPGRRLVDTNEGMVIKEIGKEALLEKIKGIFQVGTQPQRESQMRPVAPPAPDSGASVAGFAEGFLSVINSTLSAMNRGLSTGIQQKLRERQQRSPEQQRQRRVPLPALEEIPKPPVFNLKFDRNIRPAPLLSNQAGYPTFSNNFAPPVAPTKSVEQKNYSELDVSEADDYSQIDLDKSQIKSDLSHLQNGSEIARSGSLARSRQ